MRRSKGLAAGCGPCPAATDFASTITYPMRANRNTPELLVEKHQSLLVILLIRSLRIPRQNAVEITAEEGANNLRRGGRPGQRARGRPSISEGSNHVGAVSCLDELGPVRNVDASGGEAKISVHSHFVREILEEIGPVEDDILSLIHI